MVEILMQTGITKEIGWLYYLGPDGNIWRSKMAKGSNPGGQKEKVADAGIQRESGWLYFINKNGDVDLDLIKNSITKETFLITILHGNNEIGNIYPIKDFICVKPSRTA